MAETLERLIEQQADLAVTETVVMEVLAGATTTEAFLGARARFLGLPVLKLEGLADFEEAARLYRLCRAAGETLRSHLDCLVAVPTMRHGASLLQNDRDFTTIARHTALKLEPLDDPRPSGNGRHVRERKASWRKRKARPSRGRASAS